VAVEAKKPEEKADPNQPFYEKAERGLRQLYENAKAKNELHFVTALMPEMRGMQDAGWNTAEDQNTALSFCPTL